MPFVITSACTDVKDKTCISQCPVDCIYEGARKLYINPDECIDCGACEPTCPVEAIFPDLEVPAAERAHTAANSEFFAGFGNPGGAADFGPQDHDVIPDTRARA